MTTLETLAREMTGLPRRVLAGVSGGADSVALLLALTRVPDVTVAAVHVNHGLRGAASDEDEAFVRALCAAQRVPLWVYRATPPKDPGEDWARRARYGFFREAMAASGAEALVLAHHMDDQAETLLLHLLRGAGLTGLAGMRADTVRDGMRILRPLLRVTRMQLREALTDAGQPWREDATNDDPQYLRNAVRTQLLPLMEALAPGAAGRLAGTAAELGAERAYLAAQTDAFLKANAGPDWLALRALREQPEALQASILRAWWEKGPGGGMDERCLSRAQTAALLQLMEAQAGAKCNLPGRWLGQRGWHCLHLVPPEKREAASEQPAADGACVNGVTVRIGPAGKDPGDGKRSQALPRALLAQCVVRTRRQGDWLRPFGGGGRQSLQDCLTDRRVDAPFRDRLPLLCRGSEVLLIAGVGAGDIPPMTGEDDSLCLTWTGDMPWTIQ